MAIHGDECEAKPLRAMQLKGIGLHDCTGNVSGQQGHRGRPYRIKVTPTLCRLDYT